MRCINFYIFRSFYHTKGTYGITESHHNLKGFQPYLLVSSEELLIILRFTEWQYFRFILKNIKIFKLNQNYVIYCLLLLLAARFKYHIMQYGTYRN